MPTRTTKPPRIDGSTCLLSSTRRPVWRPISSPMRWTTASSSSTALVTVTGSRSLASSQRRSYSRRRRRDDRQAVVLQQHVEDVRDRRVGVDDRAAQPLALLLRGEVRREQEQPHLAVLPDRVVDLAELLADDVELVPAPGRPRTASARRPGRSAPSLSAPRAARMSDERPLVAPLAAQRREVELADGLVDQAPLVVARQHAPGDLLGRLDRQVGDLAADLGDRAARLGVDVLARLLEQLLALLARLVLRVASRRPRRSCARARRCRPPARAPP